MTLSDEAFKQGIMVLLSAFSNLKPTKAQIKIWKSLLSDLTDQGFLSAVVRISREVTDIYSSTNVIALIRDHAQIILEGPKLTAEDAWEEVMREIRATGYANSPSWSDPLVAQAVRAIGWKELCHSDESQLSFHRAHFFRCFGAYSKREEEENINEEVKGLITEIGKQKAIAGDLK